MHFLVAFALKIHLLLKFLLEPKIKLTSASAAVWTGNHCILSAYLVGPLAEECDVLPVEGDWLGAGEAALAPAAHVLHARLHLPQVPVLRHRPHPRHARHELRVRLVQLPPEM